LRPCRLEVTSGAAIVYPLWFFLDSFGWFSAAVPAILCHELGHWIAVSLSGEKVFSLRLEVFGLCMETTPFSRRREEIFCLAAGPVCGMLWGAVAFCMKGAWAGKSAAVSLGLNLFNLLPALPLDGGRILLAATGRGDLVRASSLLTAGLLICAVWYGRLWACIPAVLIVGAVLTA